MKTTLKFFAIFILIAPLVSKADGFVPDRQTRPNAPVKPFPMDISVMGVGTVRIDQVQQEQRNEPLKIYMSVKCNGSNSWRQIARPFGIGRWKALPTYDNSTKTLTLRYNTCRTEPSTGDVTCDQGGQPLPFPVGDVCNPSYRAPILDDEQATY